MEKTIKVYRFASFVELGMFMTGDSLRNKKEWHTDKTVNSSRGFCFLSDTTVVKGYEDDYFFSAFRCQDFMGGVVSDQCLMCLEVEESLMTKSHATYGHPCHSGTCLIEELCCDSYNNKQFKLIGVCFSPLELFQKNRFGEAAYEMPSIETVTKLVDDFESEKLRKAKEKEGYLKVPTFSWDEIFQSVV